jgi:hypothetical protein
LPKHDHPPSITPGNHPASPARNMRPGLWWCSGGLFGRGGVAFRQEDGVVRFYLFGSGMIRAETIQQAVALVGHPDVNVYELPPDAVWPDDAGEAVGRISSVCAHCKFSRCSLILRIV